MFCLTRELYFQDNLQPNVGKQFQRSNFIHSSFLTVEFGLLVCFQRSDQSDHGRGICVIRQLINMAFFLRQSQ